MLPDLLREKEEMGSNRLLLLLELLLNSEELEAIEEPRERLPVQVEKSKLCCLRKVFNPFEVGYFVDSQNDN